MCGSETKEGSKNELSLVVALCCWTDNTDAMLCIFSTSGLPCSFFLPFYPCWLFKINQNLQSTNMHGLVVIVILDT